jgi:transposase
MSVFPTLGVSEAKETLMVEQGVLIMSRQERDRLQLITQLAKGTLKASEFAKAAKLSLRQVYRLLARYRAEGDKGVIHRLRGRPSNHGYDAKLRQRVLTLYWQPCYRDYGPTLFTEALLEEHHISVNHETVRRWLMAKGGSNVQRKKRPHRRKRQRRAAVGELVQFDGSTHDWFEGRGPVCCLLHAIDDATGRVHLMFAPTENSADVMRTFWAYCKRYGAPRGVYLDRSSVFYTKRGKLTDAARALRDLGVELIFANSPQAKGRVERGNRTHQDRLIKALRRSTISTIAEANRFLERSYIDHHNQRFALPATDLPDVHRPLPEGINLRNVFCFQTTRSVYNDYTITLEAQFVQLERSAGSLLPSPGQHVIVRRWLDGSLHIFWKDHELTFSILNAKPKRPPAVHHRPAADHPWRATMPIGRKRYRSSKPSKRGSSNGRKKTVSFTPTHH